MQQSFRMDPLDRPLGPGRGLSAGISVTDRGHSGQIAHNLPVTDNAYHLSTLSCGRILRISNETLHCLEFCAENTLQKPPWYRSNSQVIIIFSKSAWL